MMHLQLIGQVNQKMLKKTAKFVEKYRRKIGEDFTFDTVIVELTSEGGDPDTALAIAAYLRQLPKVTVRVYGCCYSAATLIFAVGHNRQMHEWAMAMVHESSASVDGNSSSLKHHAKNMEKSETHWNHILQNLTGTEAKVWEKLNEKDTYLNAEECLKLNLATEIYK